MLRRAADLADGLSSAGKPEFALREDSIACVQHQAGQVSTGSVQTCTGSVELRAPTLGSTAQRAGKAMGGTWILQVMLAFTVQQGVSTQDEVPRM